VVYDANVLYPNTLRDLPIRIAQAGMVQARWTGNAVVGIERGCVTETGTTARTKRGELVGYCPTRGGSTTERTPPSLVRLPPLN